MRTSYAATDASVRDATYLRAAFNDCVVGSVNANLTHYAEAADVLARADVGWLERLISRRVPLERYDEAFEGQDDDVKVVITLDG